MNLQKSFLFGIIGTSIGVLLAFSASAQHPILDPNDPIVEYNAQNPPTNPPFGFLTKWVRTDRMSWNTDSYKSYYLNGMVFRLKWPANYDPSGDTKYPLIIMLHGRGERGTIYDNEWSMQHGGRIHRDAVDNGTFDGFVLFPQNTSGFWGNFHFNIIDRLIQQDLPLINVDVNRISVHGLSAGGQATWNIIMGFPKNFASAIPMSAASNNFKPGIPNYRHIPVWLSQGGLDNSPHPALSRSLVDDIAAQNGNIRYSLYHTLGHGVWNTHYNDPDFFPFMLRAHKANPSVLSGEFTLIETSSFKDVYQFLTKNEFCPGETVVTTLGLTAGFDGYEWRKDGVLIPGASSNEISVSEFGVYDARVRRGADWSDWSTVPIEVQIKGATLTPDIQVVGLNSKVLPASDGSTTVDLELPQGFIEYQWFNSAKGTLVSSERVFTVTQPGEYVATVTEQFGCSSNPSTPFVVVDAGGTNGPDQPIGLSGLAISETEIQLNWSDNPSPANNETGFEIYRSLGAGSYSLIAITNADILSYLDSDLTANTTYHYVIRAVNENAAASLTDELVITTLVDSQAPTAPLNLVVTASTLNSVTLSWDASTDDVGVFRYDIYRNGIKSIITPETSATVFNLLAQQVYTFSVKARDLTGNESPASNQVVAAAVVSGLNYKYYEGSYNSLPDFSTLSPVEEGISPNVDISIAPVTDNILFLWEGFITIPAGGDYIFETISDDGSKLYIGTFNSQGEVVDNDGLHGMQSRTGTYNFSAPGIYPIFITFFERTGGQGMEVYWQSPANGLTRERIPDTAFKDDFSIPDELPLAPTNFVTTAISDNEVDISWTDNSDNETGFQIYRTDGTTNLLPVHITQANETSFTDSGLDPETTYNYTIVALGQYGQSSTVEGVVEPIGDVNSGIAARDSGTGIGYIMFSQEDVHVRFLSNGPHSQNSDHLIAVLNINGTWHYDNNTNTYRPFVPEVNDLLIASVDFTEDLISSFEGTTNIINGVEAGFAGGDLTFAANQWNGGFNSGEFTVNGTFFTRNQNSLSEVTTFALPPAPNAPNNLTATALSPVSIQLSWNDNSDNEDAFEILRSSGGNTNFLPIATLPANSTATVIYEDSGLFANATYYYKVIATNSGGEVESNETVTTTLNNNPQLNPIDNVVVRYDTQSIIAIASTDIDPEQITLTAINLPGFATLTDNGDGSGSITLLPGVSDEGIYSGIEIRATDEHAGIDSEIFTIEVNGNFIPGIASISPVVIDEGQTQDVLLSATDGNGVVGLIWSITDLPSFVELIPGGLGAEGQATLRFTPDFIDAGQYSSTVTVTDPEGASADLGVVITINDIDPNNTILLNITNGVYVAPGNWNNTNGSPAQGANYSNLIDDKGASTSIGATIISAWNTDGGFNNSGSSTGNNSGVFPDLVSRGSYWTWHTSQEIMIYGLEPTGKRYNFTFFGSRNATNNRTTNYTIGGETVSLNAAGNTSETVSIASVAPNAAGEVVISIDKGAGSSFGYLNALKIESILDLGLPPAIPTNAVASYNASATRVDLTWDDNAFDEAGYEIHRSEDINGPYTHLNPSSVNANASSYEDADVAGNRTYHYKVRAFSNNGLSEFSDIATIAVPNANPVLVGLGNQSVSPDEQKVVLVGASDDVEDIITLSATYLPGFATFNDLGNGQGELLLNPVAEDIGSYQGIEITATDNNGGFTQESFSIEVLPTDLVKVYVNFTGTATYSEGAPWNNFIGKGSAGLSIPNLLDDQGSNSGTSISLTNSWGGANTAGMNTGNNSGIVPDNVMRSSIWEGNTAANEVVVSGLDISKVYNFEFFASRNGSGDRTTVYTIQGQGVSLNASFNTDQTVKISGVFPDTNGQVSISIQKGSGASYGYLNGLIIESASSAGLPAEPTDLTAVGISNSDIILNWVDNSNTEIGFEIWRADTETGPFDLAATVGIDIRTYIDTGLAANSNYYYQVRADLGAGEYSDFTATASANTVNQQILVNFNVENSAIGWYNTNSAPDADLTFSNITDEGGNNTGISMTIVESSPEYDPTIFGFSGDNPFGMNTGNDSGVVPDNVMRSSYWLDQGRTAQLRFASLDLSLGYNFIFFASRNGGGNRTTEYSIDSETVSLNASYNTNETVRIDDVRTDANGEILLTISAGPNSTFGYIGGLIIQTYEINQVNTRIATNDEEAEIELEVLSARVNVYPNPYRDYVNVEFNQSVKSDVTIRLMDIEGKLLLENVLKDLDSGDHFLELDLSQIKTNKILLLQLFNDDGNRVYRLFKDE